MLYAKPWYKTFPNIILLTIIVLVLGDLFVAGVLFGPNFMVFTIFYTMGFSILYVLIAYAIWISILKKAKGYRSVLIMLAILIALLQFTLPKIIEHLNAKYFANDMALLIEKAVKGEEIPQDLLNTQGNSDLSILTKKTAEELKIFLEQMEGFKSAMELCTVNKLVADGLVSDINGLNNALKRISNAQNELDKVRKAAKNYDKNVRISMKQYYPNEISDKVKDKTETLEEMEALLKIRDKELKVLAQMFYHLKDISGSYKISSDGRFMFQRQKDMNVFNKYNSELIALGKQWVEEQQTTIKEAERKINQLRGKE